MILICTCSQDGAVELLSPYLRGWPFFRFNIDKCEDYDWDISDCGFRILDRREGVSIDQDTLSSFYLRKPIFIEDIDVPKGGCLENWRRKETEAIFEDLYHECESRGKTVVVHSRSLKYGKLRQMWVAKKYFHVAKWHMFRGALPLELRHGRWVVKSLTGTAIGQGKCLFVTEVEPSKLDLAYPWFLQEKIIGDDEVTVVYLDGQLFAYRYPRESIKDSEDVRMATLENASPWKPCELSPSEQVAIRGFMAETGYRFGRFDFIRKDGELWFLELNPNGQWAWLDERNENGLIAAVAAKIVSEDKAHLQKGGL